MPTLKELIQNAAVGLFVERPGAKKTVQQWTTQLEDDARAIEARARSAKNQQKAQIVLRHISGIERWGQRRLSVFLGEPLLIDEYDNYQPAKDLTTEQQVAEFRKTRAQTIEIVRKIASTPTNDAASTDESKVLHNQFGPISLRGWLRYLNMHANLESKKIR